MKKLSHPAYSPPVPTLANYYHPPEGSEKVLSAKISAQDIADEIPSYSPPVSSLADYYRAESSPTKTPKSSPKKPEAAGKSKKILKAKKAKKKK